MEDFQKYRAVIDIDGNSWSSRFADLMCMNSVMIKVQPDWVDYFYPELRPWVHYIPVYGNLMNLVEVVAHVTAEDQETQQQMRSIVQNANSWCRSKMTAIQMSIDMIWIMISYVEMLKKEDSRSGNFTKWKEDFSYSRAWNTENWIEIPVNETS